MAVASQDIQKNANTFILTKMFGTYMLYEPCFGNVVKLYGQAAYGSMNRVSPLVRYMRSERNTDKLKVFYIETNISQGLINKPLPKFIIGKSGTSTEYKEGNAKFLPPSSKPKYDILIKETAIYYCIENTSGEYLLYDYDMGNPLMGEIEDKNGNTYVIKSGTEKNTLKLIDSLPQQATVYSLKVDKKNGIVNGNELFRRFNSETAKKQTDELVQEKNKDFTKMKMAKEKKRIEKMNSLVGNN